MFGNGGKKKPPKARPGGAALSSFGLMDMPGTDEFGNISLGDDNDENDDELEAELNAIMYGGSKAKKPIKKKNVVSSSELQSMVDICMQGKELFLVLIVCRCIKNAANSITFKLSNGILFI